jgi:hypothetical protein
MANEFTTVGLTKETKERLDKQRQTPKGEVSVEDYLNYLLDKEEKKQK